MKKITLANYHNKGYLNFLKELEKRHKNEEKHYVIIYFNSNPYLIVIGQNFYYLHLVSMKHEEIVKLMEKPLFIRIRKNDILISFNEKIKFEKLEEKLYVLNKILDDEKEKFKFELSENELELSRGIYEFCKKTEDMEICNIESFINFYKFLESQEEHQLICAKTNLGIKLSSPYKDLIFIMLNYTKREKEIITNPVEKKLIELIDLYERLHSIDHYRQEEALQKIVDFVRGKIKEDLMHLHIKGKFIELLRIPSYAELKNDGSWIFLASGYGSKIYKPRWYYKVRK